MLFPRIKNIFYLVFPVTSFLVLPFLQGTTPAFVLCYFFLFTLAFIVPASEYLNFYKIVFGLIVLFFLLTILSQVGVFFSDLPPMTGVTLVDTSGSSSIFLRKTIFTQHLYLFGAVIAFAFVTVFYRERDLNLIFWGVRLLLIYGIIEWLGFLLTGHQIDFLSNRVFDDGIQTGEGSLFQTMIIGGVELLRMKSLTGEPSMFAFTVLPFWVLAIENKRRTDIILTTGCLILSLSTTAALGFFVYGVYKMFRSGIKTKLLILLSFVLVAMVLFSLFGDTIQILWEQLVVEKFSGESVSGQDRFGNYYAGVAFWLNSNLWVQLFGVGFGVVRSTDFFTTALVNSGLVGILFWFLLFFAPYIVIPRTQRPDSLGKILPCLIVTFVCFFLSVSEYMYLSLWLPLGMVYNQVSYSAGKAQLKPMSAF